MPRKIALLALFLPLLALAQTPTERLHQIFDAEWVYLMRQSPEFSSFLGGKIYNDRWSDLSLEAIERRHQHTLEILEQLKTIDPNQLSAADRLNYTLFRRQYEETAEEHEFRWFLVPLNQREGIQTADDLAASIQFTSRKDYEDWIARMEAFPRYMQQTMDLMKQGLKEGMVQPKVVMQRVPDQILKQIPDKPTDSLFLRPFQTLPDWLTEEEQETLRQRATAAASDHVLPSYRQFHKFFIEEYLPGCQDGVGAWRLPRGRDMYAFRARQFTTTGMTPQQIHATGLREVKRIRAEMEAIIERVEFDGSFDDFLEFLRTDPQFYYDSPEELFEGYLAVSKRIDPTLVKLFGTLPRTPYGVEPIPDNIAPDTTTAYYRPPAADGSRAGTYFVNLYKPEVRPKYEMEALSIHEAVPGHHLQIALAQELGDLPEFRKFLRFTAFTEGWGLYSESLGEELGFYQDPYSKFGQLTYEMWRAVRLVVDTGMHDMEWTRDEAIEFFKANAAKTEQDIVNEIDRYIAWPGQALAYKIGELQIKQLRAQAETELGEDFDIRQFHDTVLGAGAIPLDVLETNIEAWITTQKAATRN